MVIMSDSLKVAFLEVGHGDSIVIIYPNGTTAAIIDTPNSKLTYDFLDQHGITHVDWAIVSHGDSDHYKGIASLVINLQNSGVAVSKIGYIRGDKRIQRENGYNKIRMQFKEFATLYDIICVEPYSYFMKDSIACTSDVNLKCIYPYTADDVDAAGDEPNDWSIVLILEHENYRVLLPGDLEGKGWYRLKSKLAKIGTTLQSDVFKLPHHGRWFDGGSEALALDEVINIVDTSYGIISAGYHDGRSCPSPETIQALNKGKRFSRVLCTGSGKSCHDGNPLEYTPPGIILGKSSDGKSAPCAGTIIVEISKSGINIRPSQKDHEEVISKLKNPICLKATKIVPENLITT